MGAPEGNSNAQKGPTPATSFLYIKIRPEQKRAYVRAARGHKRPDGNPGGLTDWATHHLDKAAGIKPADD